MPPGAGDVQAWGHGPLNGTVDIDDPRVTWDATDVVQGTFVEGRVAVPAARLPQLPAGVGARLPTIVAEETSWADAANDNRARAARSARREQLARDALTFLIPFLVLGGALGFWVIWRRWGKEPQPVRPVGEYVRDLPDDPPAVVDGLLHWGTIGAAGFSATVLDLAQRGFLTVREVRVDRVLLPDRVDYELTETTQDRSTIKAFERTTLEQVFASGPTVLQSEIAKYARKHQSEAQARWKSFQANAGTSLRNRRYINGDRSAPFVCNIGIAVVIGLGGAAALAVRLWPLGVLALAWAATQLALTPLLRQRSPEGHTRALEWQAVRRYLRDFSALDEAPVGHLVLWERYLVYAAVLGVSEQLAQGLAARIPDEQHAEFAPWYHGFHGGPGAFGSIGDFSAGLAGSTAAFTPQSSGSGSGGGFSGGGGGGGGGGGIGAG